LNEALVGLAAKYAFAPGLGGHAYSAYNAVAGLIGDYSVVTTGGGDNYVLAQQCARYLLGSLARVRSGKPIGASVAYFTNHETLLRKKSISAKSPEDFLRSDIQLEALSWLSVASVTAVRCPLFALRPVVILNPQICTARQETARRPRKWTEPTRGME